LQSGAGGQFDPAVTEAVTQVLRHSAPNNARNPGRRGP
jgi:hypothetical protein